LVEEAGDGIVVTGTAKPVVYCVEVGAEDGADSDAEAIVAMEEEDFSSRVELGNVRLPWTRLVPSSIFKQKVTIPFLMKLG